MPPTTGGSTSGSRTNERSTRRPRKSLLASTMAIGTPSTTHSTVARADVRRLSVSAATDDSEVISARNCAQSTRVHMATSGNSTNTAPTAAGTNSQAGSPIRLGRPLTSGLGEPGCGQDRLPGAAGDRVLELLRQLSVLAVRQERDRVDVHRRLRLLERHALHAAAGPLDVGDVDQSRIALTALDLGEHVGDRLLLTDRLDVDPGGLLHLDRRRP